MLVLCLVTNIILAQTTVNYTESNAIISNPERGLQKYSITNSNYNTQTSFSNLSQTELTSWRTGSEKVSVLFRYFLLDAFLSSDISLNYLNNMQKDFNIIRNAGLKCIVRFSYSDAESANPQQPTKAIILKHIGQIAPILNLNKDVIFSHQAGFIGTWGEWYYTNSTEFGTEDAINSTQWNNRKAIVDSMLKATPLDIPLQVRYVNIKKTLYGSVKLTPATAYQNTPNARIGFFNDAFLNNWGDMGTYDVNSSSANPIGTPDYLFLANETLYTPMTGETNGLNAPRTSGSNAVFEMDSTNWTCINRDYYIQNWTNWKASMHYDEIMKKTGYRFVLKNSTFAVTGNILNIEINIKNEGYARLFKQRNVYLILQNKANNQVHSFSLNADPRTWQKSVKITQSIDITTLPIGEYLSYIYMPDNNASISNRVEYAIQFANTDTWNSTTGYNALFQDVIKTNNTAIPALNNSDSKFKLYPNPVTNQAILHSKEILSNAKLTILNSNGQSMFCSHYKLEKSFSINRNNLPKGLYIIQLTENNIVVYSNKLVII